MAQIKIACRICGDVHNLDPKHFPLEIWDFPQDKHGKRILGQPQQLVGYACAKCDRKNQRDTFVKKHNITTRNGQGLAQAITDKLKELSFKSKILSKPVKPIVPKQGKQSLFQRIKNKLALGRQMRGGK